MTYDITYDTEVLHTLKSFSNANNHELFSCAPPLMKSWIRQWIGIMGRLAGLGNLVLLIKMWMIFIVYLLKYFVGPSPQKKSKINHGVIFTKYPFKFK